MSASWTTSKMAQRHEADVAEVLGGRQTRGSGNQWRDTTDGKHVEGTVQYGFAWDGKSTTAKSTALTRRDWEKLVDQADDFLPAMPIRFYQDTRLTQVGLDLIVTKLDHFAEILAEANLMAAIRDQGCLTGTHATDSSTECKVCGEEVLP